MNLRTLCMWSIATAAVVGAGSAPLGAAEAPSVDRAAAIEAAIGTYVDESWSGYLQGIGERMVAASQRPDLKLRFSILDDPSINVFPVPPGHIYLTRGLLAYIDSEAELAAVLGHAIAHLTERHKVYPLSHEDLIPFGLGVADRASPQVREFTTLLPGGLETIVAAYKAGDDQHADELALRSLERAGYDLEALPALFEVLEDLAKRPEPSRLPNWWTTHPGPDNRPKRAAKEVSTFPESRRAGDSGRQRFLPHLDGLIVDWNLDRPYLDKIHYSNPAAGFRLDLPPSWAATHFGEELIAVSPEGDAVIHVTPVEGSSNVAALRAFFKEPQFVARRSWRKSVSNISAVWATFDVHREERDLEGRIGFVVIQDRVYSLLGYGIERLWMRHLSAVQNALEGIRKMPPVDAEKPLESARIELLEMEEEMSIGQIEEAYPLALPKRTVRIMNRLGDGRRTAIGELYKHVVGGLHAPAEEEEEAADDAEAAADETEADAAEVGEGATPDDGSPVNDPGSK